MEMDGPVEFLGVALVMNTAGRIGVHMNDYIAKMNEVQMCEISAIGAFAVGKKRLGTTARQIVGSMMWLGGLHFRSGLI